ncbi:MAG: ester cyclase [Rhodobacteraceae bacterium]|nr:ester cyclase [Paracoccaceae bacterium]
MSTFSEIDMRRYLLAAVALTTFVAASASAAEIENKATVVCEGNEKNRDTYLQMWKILFMDRDGARAGEFYAPQVISHNSDAGGPGSTVTPADMAKMWAASKKFNPERVLEDELILCAGDYVVVRTTIKSADNAGIGGYPPTGKPYTATATDIYRFNNGKVVERWGNSDLVSIFRQAGYTFVPKELAPPPPSKPME